MITKVYAIRDKKIGEFAQPYFVKNEDLAKRSLAMAMSQPGTQLHDFAEDFELMELGEWDTEKGKITSYDFPIHVCELQSIRMLQLLKMHALENAQKGKRAPIEGDKEPGPQEGRA